MRNLKSFLFNGAIVACLFSIISFDVLAEGYQELTPITAYVGDTGGLYIVMAQNIGVNGCSQDKNSIYLKPGIHSEKFIDRSFAITLAAIAGETSIKVYWDDCLSNGRPKAKLLSFGAAEIN